MSRIVLSTNKYWKFFRGEPPKVKPVGSINPHDKGVPPFVLSYDDTSWETVHLPHTVRVEKLNCSGGFNYQGEAWYRKTFTIDKDWKDKELYFEFDGAMHRVDAWLDGEPLDVGLGGYLPMKFDVTGIDEGEHTLILKVDNSDMSDVPPGKPQTELDFCYFGGIYRNAWFVIANKVRFSDAVHEGKPASGGLFVRTFLNDGNATIKVRANWLNHTTCNATAKVVLTLDGEKVYESKENTVAPSCDTDVDCEFNVESPILWTPDNPHLYTLCANLIVNGEVVDEKVEKVGIRTLDFRPDGFYLNGKKTILSGVNRHQEYAYIGNAISDTLKKREARLIREMGCNLIRMGHYPPDEEFLSACDEEGILVVIPTLGWQYFPTSVTFVKASYECTRRMMRLLRNHPSVLLWEPILNETDYPEYFARDQLNIVKEESLDLPVWCASDYYAPYAINYPVLYTNLKDKYPDKPLFIREYADHYMEQYGPMKTLRRVRRGENTGFYPGGEKAMIRNAVERYEKYVENKNLGVCGFAIWAGIDHNRGYEPTEGAVGLLDFLRLPKFYYYLFDSQQNIEEAGAKCFIASYWTENSPTDVTVYTNAEKVRLLLNGKEIGVKYANGTSNEHPPVVFENVPYEKGTLLAQAMVGDKVVKEHSVTTYEKAEKLVLTPQYLGENYWIADGADVLMVHVKAVDKNGNVVYSEESDVEFEVQGDAQIVGKAEPWVQANKVKLEAGEYGVVLKAGLNAGKIVLKAISKAGIESGEIELCTVKDEREYLPCEEYARTEIIPTYDIDKTERFSIPVSIHDEWSHCWDMGIGKPATASSCMEGTCAENANQKTFADPWVAKDVSLPQWWCVDFEEELTVNGVGISWQKDGLWYDFEIYTSLDGNIWDCHFKGHASGQTRTPNRLAQPTKAKYLKVVVVGVSANEPVGIYHVEIFGNK